MQVENYNTKILQDEHLRKVSGATEKESKKYVLLGMRSLHIKHSPASAFPSRKSVESANNSRPDRTLCMEFAIRREIPAAENCCDDSETRAGKLST